MKTYRPTKLIFYLIKEFTFTLFLVFSVFLSLALLINFVEEISFFKDKKLDNFISIVIFMALSKSPNTILELSLFIFLFSGISFFIKIEKNNELNTILLSGIPKIVPVIIPAIYAFCIGLVLIFGLSPISSSLLKAYENSKRIYTSNENLIVINSSGLWFMENLPNGYNFIKADKIKKNDFSRLDNLTIYNLDSNFNFIKRIDSENAIIKNKNWTLEKAKIFSDSNDPTANEIYKSFNFISSINIDDLKSYFLNANTVSFLMIPNEIQKLNKRGYSADELKVKMHKYLSLPIYLFGMILLSNIVTYNYNRNQNTILHIFYGLVLGFLIYFVNDLSIAIGMSNKVPLILATWSPTILLIFIVIINLLKINEK